MALPIDENYRQQLENWYTGVITPETKFPEDERLRVLELIRAYCAIRAQNMRGDNVDQYCFAKAVESVDWAAVAPQWMKQITIEYNQYWSLVEESRTGNPLAELYRKKAVAQRPQLESLQSLIASYIEWFAAEYVLAKEGVNG